MNKSRFDKIVENRTQERVEARIAKFREAIGQAFRDLHPNFGPKYYDGWLPDQMPEDVEQLMKILSDGAYLTQRPSSDSSYGKPHHWPRILWEDEEDAVQKQLLATMDEMQKALCAPDASASDIRPMTENTEG